MTKAEAAAILGVNINSSKEEARKAYLTQARLLHPDRFAGFSQEEINAATKTMARLNHAIEVFTNSKDEKTETTQNYTPPTYAENTNTHSNNNTYTKNNTNEYFDEFGSYTINEDYGEWSKYANFNPPSYPEYESQEPKIRQGMVGPVEALRSFFANAFKINYSSSRAEFWWIAGWLFLLDIFFYAFETIILKSELPSFTSFLDYYTSESEINAGFVIVYIALIIPSVTLAIRRLHDVKISGLWFPTLLILPITGFFFLEPVYAIWPVAIGWMVLFIFFISGSRGSKWPSLLRGYDNNKSDSTHKRNSGKFGQREWVWFAGPVVLVLAHVVRGVIENFPS